MMFYKGVVYAEIVFRYTCRMTMRRVKWARNNLALQVHGREKQ